MLVGYMRVSKADGSQTVELQRDALLAAGVDAAHVYDDHASGRRDDRPGLASCLKALRERRHTRRLEARPTRPQPAPPRQHRPRPDRPRRRAEGPHRPRRGDRHHHPRRETRLRDLRRTGRIRTRAHLRAHRRRTGVSPGARPQRRPAVQDDLGQAAPRDRIHGPARHQGQRALRRVGGHPPNPLPTRLPDRRAPTRRTQAPRRSRTQTTMISGLGRHWHAWSAARTRRGASWQRLARSTITASTGPAGGELRWTRFAPRRRPDDESARCRDCSGARASSNSPATPASTRSLATTV